MRAAWRVLKPGGILRCQVNGLPPHAARYDTWSGVRITPDEKNIQTPYQWCLRQSVQRTMTLGDKRYGFAGASFPGRTNNVDRYTLEPGKPLNLKFRVRLADLP